jgi:hypothetical protein
METLISTHLSMVRSPNRVLTPLKNVSNLVLKGLFGIPKSITHSLEMYIENLDFICWQSFQHRRLGAEPPKGVWDGRISSLKKNKVNHALCRKNKRRTGDMYKFTNRNEGKFSKDRLHEKSERQAMGKRILGLSE